MTVSEIIIDAHYDGLNPVQLGHEKCSPRHSYGPAVRTHWLLHYIVSGCGIFVKDGKTHQVNPGDVFVIAPYEETYYEADAVNPWNYIWIGFTAETLPCPLEKPVIHNAALGKVFSEALQCKNMNLGKSAYLSAKLWELFSYLLDSNNTQSNYIDKAINCMNLEYPNGITVSEIADRLNLNRSYFSALFKEKMGVSPQIYLNNLRMERAADLMVTYQKTPTVAASSTGYTDIYNFSKMFKRHFGISPRAYIAQNCPSYSSASSEK